LPATVAVQPEGTFSNTNTSNNTTTSAVRSRKSNRTTAGKHLRKGCKTVLVHTDARARQLRDITNVSSNTVLPKKQGTKPRLVPASILGVLVSAPAPPQPPSTDAIHAGVRSVQASLANVSNVYVVPLLFVVYPSSSPSVLICRLAVFFSPPSMVNPWGIVRGLKPTSFQSQPLCRCVHNGCEHLLLHYRFTARNIMLQG
jgi:hypothetical protein